MAAKKETLFRARITPKLKALPNSTWFSIQQVGIRGTPDILGCIAGMFVGLELKATAKSPVSKLQEHHLKNIREAGGIGVVVYPENWGAVYATLESISKGPLL